MTTTATTVMLPSMETNKGVSTEMIPGTWIQPEVVWADSFMVQFLGVKDGRAYFSVQGQWIENHQIFVNPQIRCDVSDFRQALGWAVEAGVLAEIRTNSRVVRQRLSF